MNPVPFSHLSKCDLVVDAVHEGGHSGNVADDPIARLLPGCGNLGGFRFAGGGEDKTFVVLYSSGEDSDWPDFIDIATGRVYYYGDNRTPGHELHSTPRKGNQILRRVFDLLHGPSEERRHIPPFFVFTKCPSERSSRSVQFRGLAVPGYPGTPGTEDLVAVWKSTGPHRFQNYRATFTILDAPVVRRQWLQALRLGNSVCDTAPGAWIEWVTEGRYRPLEATPTTLVRTPESQTPDTPLKAAILAAVYEYFESAPHSFEGFAAWIYRLHDRRAIIDVLTRPSTDGGRDAIGRYLLGFTQDPVYVDFAIEAKCYRPPGSEDRGSAVGVRDVARLISRIRHRQFGVLVTTSFVGRQAYEEVRHDGHPIIFVSGRDIVDTLIHAGYSTPEDVKSLLGSKFPR